MSSWNDVEDRVTDEIDLVKAIQASSPDNIAAFYPELGEDDRSYSSSDGLLLFPDLLTSERVVVSLYDWRSQAEMIDRLGVDLQMLLAFRELGLVVLTANANPDRYEPHTWLHPVLSSEKTLWRSIRTPGFMKMKNPEYEGNRADRERVLTAQFQHWTSADVKEMSLRLDPQEKPTTVAVLALIVSHWLERLACWKPDEVVKIQEEMTRSPLTAAEKLKLQNALNVTAHTAALGGTHKIGHEKFLSMFGPGPITLAKLDQFHDRSIDAIWSYIAEKHVGLSLVEMKTAGSVMHQEMSAKWFEVIDFLRDRQLCHQIIEAEKVIRRNIKLDGDPIAARFAIDAYVRSAKELLDRLEKVLSGSVDLCSTFLSVEVERCLLSVATLGTASFRKTLPEGVAESLAALSDKLVVAQSFKSARHW